MNLRHPNAAPEIAYGFASRYSLAVTDRFGLLAVLGLATSEVFVRFSIGEILRMNRRHHLLFALGFATLAGCTQDPRPESSVRVPHPESSVRVTYVFNNKNENWPLLGGSSYDQVTGKTVNSFQTLEVRECPNPKPMGIPCSFRTGILDLSITLSKPIKDVVQSSIDLTVRLGKSRNVSYDHDYGKVQSSSRSEITVAEGIPAIDDQQEASLNTDLPFNQWKSIELRHGLSFSICVARDLQSACQYNP